MFCWNCGKEMGDAELFCPHCAMKQAGVPEPKAPRKKLPLLPIFLGSACAVILLAAAILLFVLPRVQQAPVDPYSTTLPDLADFLSTSYTQDDESPYTHFVSCALKDTYGLSAMEEYRQLLLSPQYQLVLEDSRTQWDEDTQIQDLLFRYTGRNEAIRWVYHKEGYQYHVKLSIRHNQNTGSLRVTLYTAHGFTLEDPGITAKSVS